MTDEIVLRFLRAGLIDVGGDDAKLEKLRETAGALAAALKKTPAKAVPFALIAFDPEAPADDPVIQEAVAALQTRWATYVNTFSGTPITVLRAVLLDAVVQAAKENEKIGAALVTSARNALPYTEAANERAIWSDVVSAIEKRVDARAEAEWSTPETINVSAMQFEPPAAIEVRSAPVEIDRGELGKKFQAAAGPHGQGPTGGNPHWPSANQHWVGEFGNRLAIAVAGALNEVAKSSEIEPINLSDPLNSLAHAVSEHVERTLVAVASGTTGLQRRTNLLWWKEALYSPTARVSYRAIPASTAGALMAFDLYKQVPIFSPASVVAFLHEAVLSLPDAGTGERPLRDLLAEALRAEELAPLRQAASELVPEPVGRGPLLGLIGHRSSLPLPDDLAFRRLLGVQASIPLGAPEWAAWIFRELQAARATQEGAEAKKRGRKTS